MRAALVFAFMLLAGMATAQNESVARFSGTSQNVSGAGEPIRINVYEWSTDAQRDAFLAAWTLTRSTAAPTGGRGGAAGGRGGRGGAAGGALPAGRGAPAGAGAAGARGGRGAPANAPPATAPDPDPAFLNGLADPSDNVPADAPADAPAIAAPGPARGGRGARGGGAAAPGAANTPETSLGAALKAATTVGVFWTSESIGYAIKYARRIELPGGAERIILVTDRRLGASNIAWKPASTVSVSDYPFSIIELRVSPAGKGEGKGVVTGKVTVDSNAQTIAVDSYDTLPAILQVERAK
jgi:hypothetical protein